LAAAERPRYFAVRRLNPFPGVALAEDRHTLYPRIIDRETLNSTRVQARLRRTGA
jgi:hypothetical protein